MSSCRLVRSLKRMNKILETWPSYLPRHTQTLNNIFCNRLVPTEETLGRYWDLFP